MGYFLSSTFKNIIRFGVPDLIKEQERGKVVPKVAKTTKNL